MANGSTVLIEEPEVDLQIVEAMVKELEEYLIKDDLFRTLIVRTSKGDQNVRMTGGDLLARLHRLRGVSEELSADQQQRLAAAQRDAESVTYSLKSRFHQRLQRDMRSRLDSLRWFLDDCAQDKQRCRADFPYEMRNRQRIEEILKELGDDAPSELQDALRQVDQRIRQYGVVTGFTWDKRVQHVYPQDRYWYLYMLPAV